jgi:FkbM family methyltransferase
MLNPFEIVRKPEYFFHPRQVFRRVRRIFGAATEVAVVALPWGAKVRVCTSENIGSDIYYYGIFDRVVPEAIARLVEPGDHCVDIGANLGQNTSLMAVRAGTKGQVWAFEPHPEIFKELTENAARWPQANFAPLRMERVALGNSRGQAWLANGQDFSHNRGSATLDAEGHQPGKFSVDIRRLDDYQSEIGRAGVCKIDVEGHELGVLQGATMMLSGKAMRDIVFEDFQSQPSPVVELLQGYGYTTFRLVPRWLGPGLEPDLTSRGAGTEVSYNFLATLEPERALKRFRRPGWCCLAYW